MFQHKNSYIEMKTVSNAPAPAEQDYLTLFSKGGAHPPNLNEFSSSEGTASTKDSKEDVKV